MKKWNSIDRKFGEQNEPDELIVRDLVKYLEGFSDSQVSEGVKIKIKNAAYLLDRIRICGQGFVNCDGGLSCGSDHK